MAFVFTSLLTHGFFFKHRLSSLKSRAPSCTPFTNGFSRSSLFLASFFADTAALIHTRGCGSPLPYAWAGTDGLRLWGPMCHAWSSRPDGSHLPCPRSSHRYVAIISQL